jgi:tRNA(Leu) C34 or U34 (ribose-2'-O)-methylase TrmL
VVLVTPEIHWNIGDIGRTCLAAGAYLYLIKPLGFSLSPAEEFGRKWHPVLLKKPSFITISN